MPQLTSRQKQILALIRQGFTNLQIGNAIGLREKTVKSHITALFKALGVTNRTQAAMWNERQPE